MPTLTAEGQTIIADLSARSGFSPGAVTALAEALTNGYGTQAQFNHPELGGMGQWSPGMIMIGDMFNNSLKGRIESVILDLQRAMQAKPLFQAALNMDGMAGAAGVSWWGADLGTPSAVGGQNETRYAYFPVAGRLAVDRGGHVTIYDASGYAISGFSQQQPGSGSMVFSSNRGQIRLEDLPVAGGTPQEAAAAPAPAPAQAPAAVPSQPAPSMPAQTSDPGSSDPYGALERLAELHKKGILTDEEFAAKKAEILKRL